MPKATAKRLNNIAQGQRRSRATLGRRHRVYARVKWFHMG